jgi:peptidoglycan/LPS O-acetylase OafA/YrhL
MFRTDYDQTAERYRTLDAWRGVAALWVVLFHCSNVIVSDETFIGRALLAGWAGVFVFFPISGYAITAAIHRPEGDAPGRFLVRRWRRIFIPYWASVGAATAIALAALPFNRGSIDDVVLTPGTWAAVLSLTQGFARQEGVINPVYWTLCYEWQFYVVVAVGLLLPWRARVPYLAAVSLGAAIYVMPEWPYRVDGLFPEYWLCFAAGIAVYLWLHRRDARGWGALVFLLVAAPAFRLLNAALLLSLGVALLFVVLAPFDARISSTAAGRVALALGAMSYSLYLIHVPVGGRVVNMLRRTTLSEWMIVSAAVTASLAAGWIFYNAVERSSGGSVRPRAAGRDR